MGDLLTDQDETFEISAVSRLTGISTHTLRIWERRYELVTPDRSDSKRRRYKREDIRHLTLIKMLVDQGFAVGTIAHLTTTQLENRVREELPSDSEDVVEKSDEAAASVCRVAVIGGLVSTTLRQADIPPSQLRIVAEADSYKELEVMVTPGSVDVLLIECATIFPNSVAEIQRLVERLNARRAIIVYHFAHSETLEEFERDVKRLTVLRSPVNAEEIRLACLTDILIAMKSREREKQRSELLEDSIPDIPLVRDDRNIPSRMYQDRQLAELAQASSIVQCECPQHLASILSGLNAFEEYSAQCENRNEDDAKLHAYLHVTTAQARRTMEEALSNLLEAEGIQLDGR